MIADDSSNNTPIQAENKNQSWIRPFHIEASLTTSTPHKGNLPFGTMIDLNYQLKRFSIHALMDGTYFLPKENITKDYNKTVNLGGGIGFELFPADENDRNVFEIRASVTRSLGSADYRNTAYRVGLQWLVRPHKRCMAPSIGAGYCLRSFSSNEFHMYNGMYVSIGVRF